MRFAREGAAVAINDVDAAGAESTATRNQSHGAHAMVAQADVTNRGQVEGMIDAVVKKLGRHDILINNAGITLAMALTVRVKMGS